MTVKSNRINTSVSFAFANIAENSLEVKQGDLLSFTADGFVTKATPTSVIMGIANDKASFPENNQTQEQWRVDYNPVIWENTYKMEVVGGDTSNITVGHFYTMDANQKLDPTTDSPSVGQFMVQDVYANCVDVRFVTNLGLAIDQYEDVRLVAVYPTNPSATPFDGQYSFELSNGTVIQGDFSNLARWTTDIEFGGNVTIDGNLQVVGTTTLGDTTANDVTANDITANSVTADITSETANIETANITDLNVDNMSYTNPVNFQHSVDIDEDLNVDGALHVGGSETVDHVLTVGEQLVLGPDASAPQFVLEATRNQSNGFAGLDANGKLPNSILPPLAIGQTFVVDTEQKMLDLTAQEGDVCVRTDETKTYIKLNDNIPSTVDDWQVLLFPGQNAWGQITGDINDQLDLIAKLSEYAEKNNLKTVNNQSLIGTGNINVDGIEKSATAPANPQQGDVYYNLTDDTIYSYDGNEWKAVGSGSFDPNGYYPGLHSGLADNLYTSDNIVDISSWNFRTTAGSESVPSSGTASLNNIKGKTVRTVARTECIISPTATDGIFITGIDKYRTLYATDNTTGTYTFDLTSGVWEIDPSSYGLTVELQQAEFDITDGTFSDSTGDVFKAYVTTSRGAFTLRYDTDNSVWELSNGTDSWTDADTTTFGITTPGSTDDIVYVTYYDECTDGSITLDFTAEVRGTLVSSAPRYLQATGVNQFQLQYLLQNVEISNGEIVSGSHYIAICPAYGGVTNGYMGYCPDGYIVNCGWVDGLNTAINIGTPVNTTGNSVTSTECSMPNANTGWFLVELSTSVDDTQFSMHPKRSGQQDANTDSYTISTVTLPTEDTDNNPLPDVMPSVGSVADELNGQTQTYTQRIELVPFSYSGLYQVHEDGLTFDYDENYIYVVLEIPETYAVEFDNTYTANDYGIEAILDENYALNPVLTENNTSYGSNLVDKLRTGVVTKEEYPQVITQDQYDALPASKNTDGIIRFIYDDNTK